jgi:crotonyl-CoA carboxylase/reductase
MLDRVEVLGLGEMPPLGVLPERMLAQLIRPERYGEPKAAFAVEEVETPLPGPGEALVYVMAAGVNYNNVWAALGRPVDVVAARQKAGEKEPFHIGGSDA